MNLFEDFMQLPLDIKMSLILAIASFTLSALSIIFVILTLMQNRKMIEESSRPYLSVITTTMNGFPVLVLKNYGSSSAIITSFKSSINLSQCGFQNDHKPFSNIVGTHLAPKQAITSMLKEKSLAVNFSINISYKCPTLKASKEYTASIPVNVQALQENVTLKQIPKEKNELATIAKTLQDIEPHIIEMK